MTLRFNFAIVAAGLAAFSGIPARGQEATATIAVGTRPSAMAVNPATNTVYVANSASGNVTVINGLANTTATIPVGATPCAVAVNPLTNKIYVANQGSGTVTVIDGATNATSTLTAGISPSAIAVDTATNQIYVANAGTVTVINGSTNAIATVVDGAGPDAIAVNPVTNKIYVANQGNSVTVIDGATNAAFTVAAGTDPYAIAVNPITNRIYVANESSSNVTVIDGATNATTTVATGTTPFAIAVNPVANKVYVADEGGSNVTVIDGATNVATLVAAGSNPFAVAVNPLTNKVYVANGGSSSVTVIDGATDAVSTIAAGALPDAVAVNPVTNKVYVANGTGSTVTVVDGATNASVAVPNGKVAYSDNYALAINPATNKIYVANQGSSNVAVIDGATNAVTTIAAGPGPNSIAVNPATNRIYVANSAPGVSTVTVIDGATNATTTIATPGGALAVNPATNKIYVANPNGVTAIDGATNTFTTVASVVGVFTVAVNPATDKIYAVSTGSSVVTVIDGATGALATVPVVSNPNGIAINAITNKIYVSDFLSSTTVIDGATNATTTIAAGGNYIAVNPVTNKIYTEKGFELAVIDGATNAVTLTSAPGGLMAVNPASNKVYVVGNNTVAVIDGATNTVSTVAGGSSPNGIAVNPATGRIYVANEGGNTVTVITEEQAAAIPLDATITPLPGNQTTSATPSFTINAQSSFSPTAPPPLGVFFQVDTCQGPWLRATGNGSSFEATAPPLPLGYHILFAYADDGQDATSVQANSPLVGAIAAYGFVVTPPAPAFALQPVSQSVASGRTVVFNALATAGSPPTYQWTLNGSTTIPGAASTTDPILMINGATPSDAGTYVCTATDPAGNVTTSATLSVLTSSSPGYLTNLSGRGVVGSGLANGVFGGFGITGSGTKQLLIRGIGPGMNTFFGLTGNLGDPLLTLYNSVPAQIDQNGPWGGTTQLVNAENALGAFTVPTNSLDAMLYDSEPVGTYSAEVSGIGTATGIALVELYDADPPQPAARLNNLSVRAPVGTGANILIGGFVIGGGTSETVLIRAMGPGLTSYFGLTGTLAQPVLTLFSGNTPIYSNTVWGGDPVLAGVSKSVGAYTIPTTSQDSLLLVTLPPGAYSAQVSGVNGGTGIAAVEVYEVY